MNPELDQLTMRVMTGADVPTVSELERAVYGPSAWSAEQFRAELANTERRHYLVVEDDGQIVAFAGADIDQVGDIMTMTVAGDYRGRGIGRWLLTTLLARADQAGCPEVFLDVRVDNEPALALYRSQGFTVIDRRPRYYQPENIDALVMRRRRPRATNPDPDAKEQT